MTFIFFHFPDLKGLNKESVWLCHVSLKDDIYNDFLLYYSNVTRQRHQKMCNRHLSECIWSVLLYHVVLNTKKNIKGKRWATVKFVVCLKYILFFFVSLKTQMTNNMINFIAIWIVLCSWRFFCGLILFVL